MNSSISPPLPPTRTKTPRTEGGLGDIDIPLAADLTHEISKNYGVLLEDVGHTLR